MVERPAFKIEDLDHKGSCRVWHMSFLEDAPDSDCTCGAVIRWYKDVLQAVFDPENQPSQYGTTHCRNAGEKRHD